MPTNFRLNRLLDVLALKECNTSGVKCGNCDKRSVESSYCFQCCSFWCGDCLSLHNGIKANKEHHTLALKDFQDEDFENILKRPTFCGKMGHEKKELEFFCKICKVAICSTCALTDHDGHAKIALESAANERKLRVKAAIESQKQRAQTKMDQIAKLDENCINTCALTDHDGHAKSPLESAANERKSRVKAAIESQKRRAQTKMNKIAELDVNCIKVQEQAARVKSEVQQFVDNIYAAVEAKKMDIFDDVENQVKESLERLGIQRQEIEQQVKMHETTIEKSEILLKRSTSAQITQPNEFQDKILQEEGDQDETADRDGVRFNHVCFRQQSTIV